MQQFVEVEDGVFEPIQRTHELAGGERMTLLCESFPSLRGVPGTAPWDQIRFARWASGPAPSAAMRLAAAFLLTVWNGCDSEDSWWNEGKFSVGHFDAVDAMRLWDYQHQAAFVSWCLKPFWP